MTGMNHWLLKSEPQSYSIDDLQREGVACWDGVRNYMARNHLMSMRLGDRGFFHHSSANPPGIAGICEVVREFYPDHTQFDPESKYFDPKASPDNPRWFMPDVAFVARFDEVVPISVLRQTPGLQDMVMLSRGSRLSVSPVTEKEWGIICELAGLTL